MAPGVRGWRNHPPIRDNGPMLNRRALIALTGVALIGAISSPAAAADTITADTEREICTASENDTSSVVTFWEELETDVKNQRLTELDSQDPGLKADIEAYIAESPAAPSAADLQVRLDALESGEGLAMLLPESTTDPDVVDTENQQKFQTEYTYDEAKQIVADIPQDPATNVQTQLDEAATAGTRVSEIRAGVFSERTEDYNQTQFELQDDFQACVDEIDDARPIPVQYLILGGAIIIVAGALAFRAWSNSKKSERHGRG